MGATNIGVVLTGMAPQQQNEVADMLATELKKKGGRHGLRHNRHERRSTGP